MQQVIPQTDGATFASPQMRDDAYKMHSGRKPGNRMSRGAGGERLRMGRTCIGRGSGYGR